MRNLSLLFCRMFHSLSLSFIVISFRLNIFGRTAVCMLFHYITSGGTMLPVCVVLGDTEFSHDAGHLR